MACKLGRTHADAHPDIGGASRLVKDYTPLINRISPFIMDFIWLVN